MADLNHHALPLHLLSPWRRKFQWLTTLVMLLLPWIQPGDKSLLRIDVPSLSLHLFGQVLRIEELYLFLLFVLAFGTAFLLITLVFGRVWCGWACPQTTLSDLAEWLAGRLQLKVKANHLVGSPGRKILVHISYLLLALLVSANLIWYFIEPQRFFSSLISGTLHSGVLVTFLIIALLVYFDLALIRRLLCREFCPYGRIQTSLVEDGTLILQLPESEQSRCIRCNSCVRTCPMEIDIRSGYQIECINCGRCLDACRRIMAKRNETGLIYYRFGVDNRGPAALLNPRVIILGLLFLFLSGILTFATLYRADASLKVSISAAAGSRILEEGRQATFFNAWINNRTTADQQYRLTAVSPDGDALELRGRTDHIFVGEGGNHELNLIVLTPVHQQYYMIEFHLLNNTERIVATAQARITPVPRN